MALMLIWIKILLGVNSKFFKSRAKHSNSDDTGTKDFPAFCSNGPSVIAMPPITTTVHPTRFGSDTAK